jgi:threonylcarbamoyladenosine tRNA methylthiotransferase MtaB
MVTVDNSMMTSMSPPTVAFCTLGCKVNQAETDEFTDSFKAAGFKPVHFEGSADVYVVNTCSVTHVGDSKSRQVLRQARRRNPGALIVATGCYASVSHQSFPLDDVLVVRNRDKDQLLQIVLAALEVHESDSPASEKLQAQGFDAGAQHARPMVKVQDGCNGVCSYCIIPRARGRSRSRSSKDVVSRVNRLVERGHKEVVITGVDLGSYGSDDSDSPDLGRLISLILERTSIPRIRVSSLEPGDFDLAWLSLWDDPRMCRHLHLPLQAGSDAVLARMRRSYDTRAFREVLDRCREAIPGLCVTTDIIVGFPGERVEEFDRGFEFASHCKFDGIHVFPYSPRAGTAAAAYADRVSDGEKKQRSALLRALGSDGQASHVRRVLGTDRQVVWEESRDGVWRGLSDDNIRVFTASAEIAANDLKTVRLTSAYRGGCWGEVTSETVSERAVIPLAVHSGTFAHARK